MRDDLTELAHLKALLTAHGIRPRRTASQNFLTSRDVVTAIVSAARGGPRAVTELGAGTGVITQALLTADFAVRAIERDRQLATILTSVMPPQLQPELELVIGDVRQKSWEWSTPYQIVGNIPYHLSGLVIRKITQLTPLPRQAVLLVQAEVGERLTAEVPQLQLIGLAVQLWGSARILQRVPAAAFWPSPRVDSALVLLTPASSTQRLSLAEREAVLGVAKHFFRSRRKQMGGVLKRWLAIKPEEAGDILRRAGIDLQQRPQEVSVSRWVALQHTLNP
jgi:16S rRNA (adenine1518-N6/adenine1519-N6)-dimethyltransferase